MKSKGFGQIIVFLFLGLIILIGGFYFYNSRQQKPASSNYPTPSSKTPSPQISPIPSNDKEAISLDIPQNYPQISWQTKKATTSVYLEFKDFTGKKYGGQVPLTGDIIEGKIQNTPVNSKLMEDYYMSKLQEQGWVKTVLHANGYELKIIGTDKPCSTVDKLKVYIGYKTDNLRLVIVNYSGYPPVSFCGGWLGEEPSPTPTPAFIEYKIFISDPLPFSVIRAKEVEVN